MGVYDFYIEKALFGCARNAMVYTVVTEFIEYRLAWFQESFTVSEVLFVFHEALAGVRELGRYSRLGYVNASMIGVKANGDVKVWIN